MSVDCSITKNYLAEKARMTNGCNIECCDCVLFHRNNKYKEHCEDLEMIHPDEAISIVQKWSNEHPRKTRLQDFLEKFPKARCDDKYPAFCTRELGYCKRCEDDCSDCWNKPLEEEVK